MLTVKPVYKLSNVPDYLKWATNTHDTIYTHCQGITNNIYGFGKTFILFFAPSYFYPSTTCTHPYTYLSICVFTRTNDGGWGGGSLHKAMNLCTHYMYIVYYIHCI